MNSRCIHTNHGSSERLKKGIKILHAVYAFGFGITLLQYSCQRNVNATERFSANRHGLETFIGTRGQHKRNTQMPLSTVTPLKGAANV